MNQVTLSGAVATDPQPRNTLSEPAVAFRLLVLRDGEETEPLYVDVVCPGRVVTQACQLGLADYLAVTGELDHHDWIVDDGLHRSRWVVVARELVVLRPAQRAA